MEQMNLEQIYFAQCEIELLVYKLCNNKRRPEALKSTRVYQADRHPGRVHRTAEKGT